MKESCAHFFFAGAKIRPLFLETEPSKKKRSMSTINRFDTLWIQSPFKHSAIIKTVMFLCLITLSAGWRKADTLGVAVGIGKQVVPALLDNKSNSTDGDASHNSDVHSEIPDFVSGLPSLYLYRDQIKSCISFSNVLAFSNNGEYRRIKWDEVSIDGKAVKPSLAIGGLSSFPLMSFVFLSDPKEEESQKAQELFYLIETRDWEPKKSCVLWGVIQYFPDGTSAKDVGLKAKEKYGVGFRREKPDEILTNYIYATPFAYTYTQTTLVLTNSEVVVRLICGVPGTFSLAENKLSKDDSLQQYMKAFCGLTVPEIKATIESLPTDEPERFELSDYLLEKSQWGFNSAYTDELSDQALELAKVNSRKVVLQVFDANLYRHYLESKIAFEKHKEELRAEKSRKMEEDKKARINKALDF